MAMVEPGDSESGRGTGSKGARRGDPARQDAQPAFVLHSHPFRETSLVVELFTRNFGRVGAVARGARRARSGLRGVLLAFQPILVSWSGRGELQTLVRAEWQGGHIPLRGLPLICGFYVNELLLKLLARHDAHEALYDTYAQTLRALAATPVPAAVLRAFERNLLCELGYAVVLDRDAETGLPIAAEERYTYVIERGPVAVSQSSGQSGVELAGQTLLDMQSDNYSRALTLQQSKALMRALINHHLGGERLHTRQLLRDLQAL
jgi:DNA repair protein RecO (recombination protein O)